MEWNVEEGRHLKGNLDASPSKCLVPIPSWPCPVQMLGILFLPNWCQYRTCDEMMTKQFLPRLRNSGELLASTWLARFPDSDLGGENTKEYGVKRSEMQRRMAGRHGITHSVGPHSLHMSICHWSFLVSPFPYLLFVILQSNLRRFLSFWRNLSFSLLPLDPAILSSLAFSSLPSSASLFYRPLSLSGRLHTSATGGRDSRSRCSRLILDHKYCQGPAAEILCF